MKQFSNWDYPSDGSQYFFLCLGIRASGLFSFDSRLIPFSFETSTRKTNYEIVSSCFLQFIAFGTSRDSYIVRSSQIGIRKLQEQNKSCTKTSVDTCRQRMSILPFQLFRFCRQELSSSFFSNFLLLFSWSLVTNFLEFLFDKRSLPIVRRECSPLTFAEKVKSDV